MRVLLIIAVLLLAGSAHAATLTICSSGCDYSSIQAAIDAANIGDTIKVQGGTYNEDVVINKDVQLIYLGAVSVNTLFTCGHKIQGGSIIAGFLSDSCNPEAFKGHISNNKATIGSVPTPEVMNKVMKLREAAKSRITNKSLVPTLSGPSPVSTPYMSAINDTTPPVLVGFDFEPKVVDLTQSNQKIKFIAQIKDDSSGYAGGSFRWSGSSGMTMGGNVFHKRFSIVSGDNLNGTYVSNLSLPLPWKGGEKIYIDGFLLLDNANNSRLLTRQDLANLGFPTVIEVKSIT